MKKILLIPLMLLIVIGIGLVVFSQTPRGKVFIEYTSKSFDCKAEGKSMLIMGNGPVCIKRYSDAGKVCTNSDQCEGDCVTDKQENLGREGICEADELKQGCLTEITKKQITWCVIDDIIYTKEEYDKFFGPK